MKFNLKNVFLNYFQCNDFLKFKEKKWFESSDESASET